MASDSHIHDNNFFRHFLCVDKKDVHSCRDWLYLHLDVEGSGRVQLKCDGTPWRMGGEVQGKLANGVSSQYSHATLELGVSSITTADVHTSAASSRLNWHPCRFKWTCLFRRKAKSGFCVCAITFQTQST